MSEEMKYYLCDVLLLKDINNLLFFFGRHASHLGLQGFFRLQWWF